MVGTVGVFDFEVENGGGVAVIVRRVPLMADCMSDIEIDAEIGRLKADLDAVGIRMKKDLLKRKGRLLFGKTA